MEAGQEPSVAALNTHGLNYSVVIGSVSRGEILIYDQLSRESLDGLFARIEPNECLVKTQTSLPHRPAGRVPAWHYTLDQAVPRDRPHIPGQRLSRSGPE